MHAFLVLCHRGLSASLDEGALALVYEAEQGHHVPVRDHEVDHGMTVGVGGGGLNRIGRRDALSLLIPGGL